MRGIATNYRFLELEISTLAGNLSSNVRRKKLTLFNPALDFSEKFFKKANCDTMTRREFVTDFNIATY